MLDRIPSNYRRVRSGKCRDGDLIRGPLTMYGWFGLVGKSVKTAKADGYTIYRKKKK
jgi:hypothetical protein